MKASDLFLECLEQEGVKEIYGVPGEENADMMISLLDSPIEFVICHHEQAAAFMADVAGRLTGKPGVCLSTLGPGATNMATGVANANMDNSPVVAVTAQAGTNRLHKESHQNMDAINLYKPITKWSQSVFQADNIPEVVHKAFKLAATEKPGACMVELPEDVAREDTLVRPFDSGGKARRPAPDEKAVTRAVELLGKAEKPIILAGNGCVRTRASKQLNRFVDVTGIHAANTFMGKGAISARHDRCLFAAGLGLKDHVSYAFSKADLVICIGYDMVEWHPHIWNTGSDKKIIHIDFEPAEVDQNYRADVEIVGDLAGSLWALCESLGESHSWDVKEFKKEREHMLDELQECNADESFPLKPQRILSDLRSVMGDEDILVSDVGAHKMWIARHYPAYHPGSCIISNGFCSMGIALPGALSAKRLYPEKNVVGLCGDGGFLMNVQELATAVQYNIPATILVWEDGGYGLIKWKQMNRFGKYSHTDFTNPDIVRMAESFGCNAIRVEASRDLVPVLQAGFSEKKCPTVIVVPVDYEENMKLTEKLGRIISH